MWPSTASRPSAAANSTSEQEAATPKAVGDVELSG
ncbi:MULTISPECIES: tail fiber protein [unclassified Streptomyces]